MTPLFMDGQDTIITPDVAKTIVSKLSAEEKKNIMAALNSTSEEAIPVGIDKVSDKVELTDNDIKIAIFGNPSGYISGGEQDSLPIWDKLYDGSDESKYGFTGEMQSDSINNKHIRLYRISYPSLEYKGGRRGGQVGIGIEMNSSYKISPDKIQDVLEQIFSGVLIKTGWLSAHEKRENAEPGTPRYSRLKTPSKKEVQNLCTNAKKSIVSRLNEGDQSGLILHSQ